MKATILAAVVLVLSSIALADVSLPSVLSDNMVLQQGKPIVIWGQADAGEKVAVTLGTTSAQTSADAKGSWQVTIAAMKASKQPITMTVAGKNTLTVENILIGEVWVCSGQSNMAWVVSGAKNAAEEIAAADYPEIRLLTVPQTLAEQPQENVKARWAVCSPKKVGAFSAVAYFFGRDLHKALGVPVGLINSSWGGSPIESWTPMDSFKTDPDLSQFPAMIERHTQRLPAAREAYKEQYEKWKAMKEQVVATRPDAATKPNFPRAPQAPVTPGVEFGGMYNGMIAPLTRLGIAGAIWYQGEANAVSPDAAENYAKELPAMIRGWRKAFGQESPFLFVQLANYMPRKGPSHKSSWAMLRDSQTATLALPKTGMAVIIDAGTGGDIHPKDKQIVGKRLALAGLAVAYDKKDVVYQGPTMESVTADGTKLVVKFKHAEGGLVTKGDNGEVCGFAVAGADGEYVWAVAKLDGDSVILTSADVAKPVAVRYAWGDNPNCSLYNKADLPAVPFRWGEEKFTPTTQGNK